ncbi:MAG: mono/diheme cytochrome c family protein/glucose/arabinose dehydrogenase [Verrucomicrobiales bacterium]|jgi:mono/diheme cytochrome c family protein/glucose/arabinose dehydrogenase
MKIVLIPALFSILTLPAAAAPGDEVYQNGFLSIEEAHQSIELPEGYSLELVLSEPEIEEPVAMAWDGNGVLYVVEMRTYMQDIDAGGEQEARSRISRHEDTNGDGVYDKHSVFIDNLLLPRMVLPLDDRIMVGITNTLDLWTYRDSDGDGVADEKVKVHEGGGRGGNMEHQPSGLIWGLDNWIYLTYEAKRYRFTNGEFKVERLPRGGGQWGLTQDDDGRLYYSTGGGENPAFFFQQPPIYGMFDAPNQTEPDFRKVYPIAAVPDVQGGLRRVAPNGGLNAFTGCAGQGIFRGDRLPADFYGNLLIPEPVGRLIRRAKVERTNGLTVLSNADPGTEFMRSRDVNFRPLGAETAPDGRMFFIDMHRGIIQQGNWTAAGSYLRGVIQSWGMDKNVGRGRIYRLVHKDFEGGPQPKMLDETTKELVAHLSHPNGWWRDTAQRMIVLREDAKSVVGSLEQLAREGNSHLGRVHALWTLEGLEAASPALLAEKLADSHPSVRQAAIRVSEPFITSEDKTILAAFVKLEAEKDADVAIQALNSIAYTGSQNEQLLVLSTSIRETHSEAPIVKSIADNAAKLERERKVLAEQRRRNAVFGQQMEAGAVIYKQLCFVCHGEDGNGTEAPGIPDMRLGPPLPNSPRVLGSGGSLVRTVLHGLKGELDGKTYPGEMLPLHANDDKWIASVTTYVRNSFGNKGGAITPEFVAAVRKQSEGRTTPWTAVELEKLEPPKLANREDWKLSASHNNNGKLNAAVNGNSKDRWDTGGAQVPGMWFQVEFPEVSTINRILLDSKGSSRDYPRGYEVTISSDGKTWSKPVAKGTGASPVTDISIPNSEAKFVRITQTGSVGGLFWSIHEIEIFGKPVR